MPAMPPALAAEVLAMPGMLEWSIPAMLPPLAADFVMPGILEWSIAIDDVLSSPLDMPGIFEWSMPAIAVSAVSPPAESRVVRPVAARSFEVSPELHAAASASNKAFTLEYRICFSINRVTEPSAA